jgi:hypothetical protein
VKRRNALSSEDIPDIRALCEVHPQYRVARLYGVSPSVISEARRGLSHKPKPAQPRRPAAKLRLSDVIEIRRLGDCRTQVSLARQFHVCVGTVWNVIHHRTWRGVDA